MKKIIKNLCLLFTLTLIVTILLGCGKKNEQPVSRVQIDVNPSVELLVNEKNIVVAVAGLNDDGKMVIAGEEIVGKDATEASQLVIDVMTQTGFILKGNVSVSENEVKVSVSSNADELRLQLQTNINAKIEKFMTDNDIKGKISEAEALTKAQLEALLVSVDKTVTAAEATAMEIKEIYAELAETRKQQVKLYSDALVEMYNNAKNAEIEIVEREETAKIIDGMDATYQSFKENYATLVTSLKDAGTKLEEARYKYLIDPTSDYQTSYAQIKEAKIKLVELEREIADMEDGLPKMTKQALLATQQATYTALVAAFDTAYNLANTAIDLLQTTLNTIVNQLVELEKTFPEEIKTSLTAKAKNIENAMNETKDNFFNDFETSYKASIDKINASVTAYKQSLKEANTTK